MATTNKRSRRSGGAARKVGLVLLTILLIGITTCAIMACYAANYIQTVILPMSQLDLDDFTLDLTSHIYYIDKETGQEVELQTLYADENRVWVDYEEIPQYLIDATVAIEDKRFWTHPGVDWKRTLNGVLLMFTGQDIQGGSTITQQLIKNLTQNDEVTVKRKIVEIFRALEFEKKYEKDEILEWYLNTIFLGEQCNGVYTAARVYFDKELSELTLAECASLIGITNNPSKYDPYLNTLIQNPDTGEMWTTKQWNKYRQELILYQMLDQGKITQAEYDEAVAQELVFQRGSTSDEEGEASSSGYYSWYVDAVIDQVISDLMTEKGYTEETATQLVYSAGYKIYTPFDPDVQAVVDSVYEDESNINYHSASGQRLQSAITIVDNETGAVVALSGGIGEKTGNRLFNWATEGKRQPGSAFKPLAAYAPAMELGLITPYSVSGDVPYQLNGGSAWPSNSYHYYVGQMTIMDAVTRSSNAVAVRVLAQVTPDYAYEFLTQKLGFGDSLVANQVVGDRVMSDIDLAPLALGGLTKGVSTYEMAAAYATFARNGSYIEPYLYTQVLDSEGQEVVLERAPQAQVVMKESTVYYMNTMLQRVITSGTGTEARFGGMTIAGKTGTTNSNNDRWFVGYSPYYTAAVWTGYRQQERISTGGSNPAAVMWQRVMSRLHENLPNRDFETSVSLTSASYCLDCGRLAKTGYCELDVRGSRVATGYYAQGEAPTEFCECHSEPVKVCLDSPILDGDGNETGLYHLAGEFCPEESVKEVTFLTLERDLLNGTYTARDEQYFLSWTQEQGSCTVHTEAPVEPTEPVDPNDPSVTPDPNDPTAPPVEPSQPPESGEPQPPAVSETPAQSPEITETPNLPVESESPPPEPIPSPVESGA